MSIAAFTDRGDRAAMMIYQHVARHRDHAIATALNALIDAAQSKINA